MDTTLTQSTLKKVSSKERNFNLNLGNNVIASVSLGHTRRFLVKSKDKEKESGVVEYSLTPGSLVVMGGDMQKHWKHSVPKELRVKETRINLTFRKC